MTFNESDLRVFADLGTAFHVGESEGGQQTFHFQMSARKTVISTSSDGLITMVFGGEQYVFQNVMGLLASENFGDLKRWASNQAAVLELSSSVDSIPIKGEFISSDQLNSIQVIDVNEFNRKLCEATDDELRVFVMDGPAGIGKTTQIRQLAALRARDFVIKQERLLLHVESTGRVMQNLDDLIAGSLQKIRAKPTFDQLRVLVRYGLVTLAIDGFDELTDPNGYELAWSQLANLLNDVRGNGQVILSGRETFVSMERMKSALPILTTPRISCSQYRLIEVEPSIAREWLIQKNIPIDTLDDERMKELLAPGSYGLRPFFLSTLVSDADILSELPKNTSVDLVAVLVDALISREQSKFGDDLADRITRSALGAYIRELCEEMARDMADNQSEVLPGQSVMWAAELCVPQDIDRDLANTLIHRAGVLPFLTSDKSRNSVRFSHRQYFVYFLSANAIRSVSRSDVPKYLRRNILGSEFLETFPKVLVNMQKEVVINFRDKAIDQLPNLNMMDRGSGNVAALLLECCCEYPPQKPLSIKHIQIDEVYLRGEVPGVEFSGVTISTLHAEKADLTSVSLQGVNTIVSLHIDELTRFPPNFPTPSWLEDAGTTVRDYQKIISRIRRASETEQIDREHVPFSQQLLGRILRYRPFWLREDNEDGPSAAKLIREHPEWPTALAWLEREQLVRIDERFAASGRSARFVHFRQQDIRKRYDQFIC